MEDTTDLIIVGAGPSALAAAIYTTREDIKTTLYERSIVGGLAAITDKVDNYPGFPDGIEGMALATQLEAQANRFGATIDFGEVSDIRDEGEYKVVTVDGEEKKAKAVLIATGSNYTKLGVPGENEYYGRGAHYCATCDGAFYRDKNLAVVGGGNSGVQEAIFLTRFAKHIDLLVRSTIKASEILQHELQKYIDKGQVTVHLDTTVEEIVGDEKSVNGVKLIKEGEPVDLATDGVFVFIGLKPNTEFLVDSAVTLDEYGLIKTDHELMTSIPGVFASGDSRSGATMQIASAVGEGASAALAIREYLNKQKQGKK